MTDARALPPSLAVEVGRLGRIGLRVEPALAVMALAGLVFVPAIGSFGALLFLAGGVALAGLRPGMMLTLALRYWPAVLLAVFCTLSFTWSREPAISFRFGLQLAATVIATLAICGRLSPRVFAETIFWLLVLSMAASVLFGEVRADIGAWIGIYGSKNAFAGAAATFTAVSFALALSRQGGRGLRMAAAGGTLFGLVLVVLAQSVGALALLVPTLLAIILVMAVPRMGPAMALFLAAFAGLALVLAGLAVSAYARPLMDLVLETTGKDLTLTGRTDLWDVAADLIAQRPLLGVGFQAFWVQGHADAEALWLMFGIEGRSGFNFHNMYISNAVEIGVLGVLLQCLVLFGAGVQTARWAIRTGEAVPALFFALTFMVILASVIEVQLFFQFSLRTVLVLAAFVYANEALRRGA